MPRPVRSRGTISASFFFFLQKMKNKRQNLSLEARRQRGGGGREKDGPSGGKCTATRVEKEKGEKSIEFALE